MFCRSHSMMSGRSAAAFLFVLAIAACTGDDGDPDDAASDDTSGRTSPSNVMSPTPSMPAVSASSPSTRPSASESAGPTAQAAQIDSCLLGRWRQTSMTSQVILDEQVVEASGWIGRVLEFRPDGTEVVAYDDASPITAVGPGGQFGEEWRGVAIYEVSTSGSTLTFHSVDFSDTTVVWQYGDRGDQRQPTGTSAPVTYTCDDTTHTQRNETYAAEFTRISPP